MGVPRVNCVRHFNSAFRELVTSLPHLGRVRDSLDPRPFWPCLVRSEGSGVQTKYAVRYTAASCCKLPTPMPQAAICARSQLLFFFQLSEASWYCHTPDTTLHATIEASPAVNSNESHFKDPRAG